MVYIKIYIFNHFYQQYLVLLTTVPRNRTAVRLYVSSCLVYGLLHTLHVATQTRTTRDRSITHSLQRWVSTKSSMSQLLWVCFLFNFIKIIRTPCVKTAYGNELQSSSGHVRGIQIYTCCVVFHNPASFLPGTFRTAVPFWKQTTYISSGFVPKTGLQP